MPKKQSETVVQPSSSVVEIAPRPSPGADPRVMANCLRDYVAAHNDSSKMFRFLGSLAAEVLADLDKGGQGEASSKSIYMADQPRGEPEKASGWASEAWNSWVKKRDERESGLQDYATNQRLTSYPWPSKRGDSKGGAGRPTLYTIEAKSLEARATETANVANADIRYIRETTPKAAWWARWFFSTEFRLTGWRRILFLTPPVFFLLAALIVFSAVWFLLVYQPNLTTGRVLTLIASAALFISVAWRSIATVGRLGDKRIIMIPEILLSFRERGVQLELSRMSNAPGTSSRLGLVRYAATCPICSARVFLNDGGREFHGRLVGRCEESPDEHVFSFDRVTRSGKSLRSSASE